jgi:hypothetical protein
MNSGEVNNHLNNGRYLLFLDILGFSELVKNKKTDEIYGTIDDTLKAFDRWEELNKNFRTLYFSDTFVFYQDPKGFGEWAFLDVYAIGGMLISALLANEVASRGSITFGEFEVRNDSTLRHQIFFGKALIEAYKSEQKENWVGITIQPSAWTPFEKLNTGIINIFENERVWRIRDDGTLLLNPFKRLCDWYIDDLIGEINVPYMEWDQPEFPNAILGFRFLHEKAKEYAQKGDFSSHEAVKYHSTIAFLKNIMGQDIYGWAEKISQKIYNNI